LATTALAGGAVAADLPSPSPPVSAPVYNWTGFYLGGSLGGIWGNLHVDATPFGGPIWTNQPADIYFGALAGANYQMDRIVLGVEGDFGGTSGSTDSVLLGLGSLAGQGRVEYLGTLRGRVGYAFDRTLVFGTGGAGWLGDDVSLNNGAIDTHTKLDHFGWVIGGGAEWAWTDKVSLRGDYLYGQFDTRTSVNSLVRSATSAPA
jgi:outer membrane immunogenic protein